METFPGPFKDPGEDRTTDAEKKLQLPEKALLFGSWSSLSQLNKVPIGLSGKEKINGRIVIIKSGRYTDEKTATGNSHISRILSAKEQWPEVLSCACNPDLEIIISNKRIVRKDVLKDNISLIPPFSFPGKLLAILFKRFEFYKGALDKGLVIFCVEQDEDTTQVLETILLELAHLNNLHPSFLDWIENANRFYKRYS